MESFLGRLFIAQKTEIHNSYMYIAVCHARWATIKGGPRLDHSIHKNTWEQQLTSAADSSKQHSWWACAAHRPDFLQSFNRKVPAIFLFISCSPYRARFRVIKINKLSLSWFLCAAAEKHIRFLICVAVGDTRPILYSLLLFFLCVLFIHHATFSVPSNSLSLYSLYSSLIPLNAR